MGQFQGHAAILIHQFEIIEGAHKIPFTQADISVGTIDNTKAHSE